MSTYRRVTEAGDLASILKGRNEGPNSRAYKARCPAHDDRNPSLSIRDGRVRILVKCHAGCSAEAVIESLKNQYGVVLGKKGEIEEYSRKQSYQGHSNYNKTFSNTTANSPPTVSKEWKQIKPPNGHGSIEPSMVRHPDYGTPSAIWHYREPNGDLIFIVCRFDWEVDREGVKVPEKAVIPRVYAEYPGNRRRWVWAAPDTPRPLYGLDRLANRPDASVIIVEGEKCADTAVDLCKAGVTVTSQGGSNAASLADWRPLRGKEVLIFPDEDAAGYSYATTVAKHVLDAGAKVVKFALIPGGPPEDRSRLPKKHRDLADAASEGWTHTLLRKALRDGAMVIVDQLPEKPRHEPTPEPDLVKEDCTA